MTFGQLKYFLAVAELLNYSHAAAELHVAQPALSQSIRRLEEEVGFPLFAKKGRNIELTPYGEEFYLYAQMAINDIEAGLAKLQSMAGNRQETIKIAIDNDLNLDDVSQMLVAFQSTAGNVNIKTVGMDYLQAAKALSSGNVDFSIGGFGNKLKEFGDFEGISLFEYLWYAYISAENPLSKSERLDNDIIIDETVIARSDNMREFILLCSPQRKPESVIVAMQERLILEMIASNTAMYVSNCDFPLLFGGKEIVRIPFDLPPRVNHLIWNRSKLLSRSAQQFRSFAKKYVQQFAAENKGKN